MYIESNLVITLVRIENKGQESLCKTIIIDKDKLIMTFSWKYIPKNKTKNNIDNRISLEKYNRIKTEFETNSHFKKIRL